MSLGETRFAAMRTILGLAMVGLWMAGCEPTPPPKFQPTAATMRVIPEVRTGMTVTNEKGEKEHLAGILETVRSHFGTLAEPKVWPLLPIDYGGTPAVVSEVISPTEAEADAARDADKPFERLTLIIAATEGHELSTLPKEAKAGWTDGEYVGAMNRVVEFDPKTGRITLAGTFDAGLPDIKDKLLLNPGHILARGQALYNRHCMHCHGAGGGGNGPTARYLVPKPRDFQLGTFKWKSTEFSEKISRADMLDTLRDGLPGTAMPSFRLLPAEELHAITEYVRWLTMRGEYENMLAMFAIGAYEFTNEVYQERIADGPSEKTAREEILEEIEEYLREDLAENEVGEDIADAWSEANEKSAVVYPEIARVPSTPESWARGRALFRSDRAKCVTCHGPYGQGNGSQTVTFTINPRTDEPYETVGLYDVWGTLVQPRDLTKGIYHGGRRPIDVYRRIAVGIKGTPMPGVGQSLTDAEIWDLVNFVMHLPYEDLPAPGSGKAVVSAGH